VRMDDTTVEFHADCDLRPTKPATKPFGEKCRLSANVSIQNDILLTHTCHIVRLRCLQQYTAQSPSVCICLSTTFLAGLIFVKSKDRQIGHSSRSPKRGLKTKVSPENTVAPRILRHLRNCHRLKAITQPKKKNLVFSTRRRSDGQRFYRGRE